MLIFGDFVCDKVCTDGEKKGKQFEVLFEKNVLVEIILAELENKTEVDDFCTVMFGSQKLRNDYL